MLKRPIVILPPLKCFCTLIKNSWAYLFGSISGFFILFHLPICLSLCQHHIVLITIEWYQVEWFLPLYFLFLWNLELVFFTILLGNKFQTYRKVAKITIVWNIPMYSLSRFTNYLHFAAFALSLAPPNIYLILFFSKSFKAKLNSSWPFIPKYLNVYFLKIRIFSYITTIYLSTPINLSLVNTFT